MDLPYFNLPTAFGLLVALAVAAWFGPRYWGAVFVVRIRGGVPRALSGTVTPAFLAAVADLCRQDGIADGEVAGIARGRRIALRFSWNLPARFRQRLRNWWVISGWRAPPRRPAGR